MRKESPHCPEFSEARAEPCAEFMLSDVLTSAEGTTSANFVKKSFSEI